MYYVFISIYLYLSTDTHILSTGVLEVALSWPFLVLEWCECPVGILANIRYVNIYFAWMNNAEKWKWALAHTGVWIQNDCSLKAFLSPSVAFAFLGGSVLPLILLLAASLIHTQIYKRKHTGILICYGKCLYYKHYSTGSISFLQIQTCKRFKTCRFNHKSIKTQRFLQSTEKRTIDG